MGRMDYRKFKQMVKEAGCTIDDESLPHIGYIYYNEQVISTFSLTHSGRSKGKEVKPKYIHLFQKAMMRFKAL
jgi:hypothetical protein